jgi:cystathionine beta-synthase
MSATEPATATSSSSSNEPVYDNYRGCEWNASTASSQKSPHSALGYRASEPKICSSVLEHIGNTPLVRLERLCAAEGIECEVLAKCEFFNAGGSVKDRIGARMFLDAEQSGRIKPGDTIIEPTSGNTGIGLALCAALKGYKMIITLPEKMSQEKVSVLKALGAQIIRTPTEAAWDSPESHIGVARRLNKEIPNSHILDQYVNPSNPLAHYEQTAEEILDQCDGRVDAIVVGAGTGGTISGIGRKFKERVPDAVVVGVDPHGSILARPESLNDAGVGSYQVEGIGYDFVPKVLDHSVVDEWIKSSDKPSVLMARRLVREEGLLCGMSSGTAVVAAFEYIRKHKLGKGKRVVVVLPDSVRNYMTKYIDDDWMVRHNFLDQSALEVPSDRWWSNQTVGYLNLSTPFTISPDATCQNAVNILKNEGFDQLPVVDPATGKIHGTVTEGNLLALLAAGRVKTSDPVSKASFRQFRQVSLSTRLGQLSRIFDKDHFALVVASQKTFDVDGVPTEKTVIVGVVSRIDLLNYIISQQQQNVEQ